MILKNVSFKTPEENILYDEVLLKLAEQGAQGEVLRLWESPMLFVVLGRISKVTEDVREDNTKKDNVPVLRRFSGGGTVLQGPGCLNYSLILSKQKNPQIVDLRRSYQFVLEKVIAAMASLNISAEFKPVSDLALTDGYKKFSGNAQHRAKAHVLHHGTILYDFDLDLVEKYLKIPKAVPEYRQGRAHKDFIANICCDSKKIKESLCNVFGAQEEAGVTAQERCCLDQFLEDKKEVVFL
ncbi:MAG: lipoate--protein ligase family protein [Candidatus Omnitrophica bacterium]|nr:lipoate--protein ligase family protein [Candidatus Omnitrophota bacterium]